MDRRVAFKRLPGDPPFQARRIEVFYSTAREKMDELVGKIVSAIAVTKDESALYLTCTDGTCLVLDTDGDCCSESWWADAVGVKQLLHSPVQKWEEIPFTNDPEPGRTRQESDQVYGLRLTTFLGSCDLIFRNSSNGFYGGECLPRWEGARPDCTPITEDWRA